MCKNLSLKRRHYFALLGVGVLVIAGLLGQVTPALAHERVQIGPYTIVVGWLAEPPLVGERNALTIEILQDNTPVTGAEAGLNAEVLYAGLSFRTNLNPTDTPGLYTAELIPTVRGQYNVRLVGRLGDLDVDETIEPEEVFPADRLQFPEAEPEPRQMQVEIVTLRSELRTARTLALIGLAAGVLGLGLAAVALFRRR